MHLRKRVLPVLYFCFLLVSTFSLLGLNVWQIKPVEAATGSFGMETSGGSSAHLVPILVGCKFTLAVDANIVSIHAWAYDGAYGKYYKFGIYDSSFNYLGTTAQGMWGGAYNWVWYNLTVTGTVALTADDYYLCLFSEDSYYSYDAGSTDQTFTFTTTWSTWPTSLTPTATYARSVAMYANYTDYAPPPPTYSTPVTNSSKAGQPSNFSIACNSGGGGLTNGFLQTNNTGTVANDTYTFSYSSETANLTKTLNATVGNVVQYKWFINGTAGGFNTTGFYNLTITSYVNFTQFTYPSVNSSRAGGGVTYTIHAYTDETFAGFIFETNTTGTSTNTTWSSLTGSSLYINATGTLNSTVGYVVSYAFYVNTSVSLWNSSGLYNITMESDAMWLHTDGVHLKDEAGNEIFLRGIHKTGFDDFSTGWWSPSGTNQGGAGTWNATAVQENLDAMKMWGANVVRLLIRVCWWINDTDSNRQHIKDVCTYAKARGMYVQYCFYMVSNSSAQIAMPYPPYSNVGDSAFIANSQEFADFWGNFSSQMKGYDNIFYWLFGEPTSDTDQNWWDIQENAINQIRGNETGGVPHIVVVSRNSGVWCNIETNATGTGVEWVANAKGNITDRFNAMIYGTDFYRAYDGTGLFNNFTKGWTYQHIMTALQLEQFDYVHDVLQVPFIIGEFGLNLGASDPTQEQEAWNATIYAFKYYEMNFCPLWWRTEYAWSLISGNVYIPKPTYAGIIFIAAMHNNPFVFSCGNTFVSGISDYYMYGNNTSWSSTWASNQLTVTYTGATQVRVFWNVSANYPMNSTLQCLNSNGTVVNAADNFDSSTSLIRLNSTASGNWLISYNVNLTVTISYPANITYTSPTIPVAISASGGTVDKLWWNCKNGSSWIYGSNQTYTVTTNMMGFVNGTAYTFYGFANNTDGYTVESHVMFSVGIYVVPPTDLTYVAVSLNSPVDGYSTTSTVITFTYTPYTTSTFENASLYLNVSGTWQSAGLNTTAILNNTVNSWTYMFLTYGTFTWNIQVYNTTDYAFANANFTLTLTAPTVTPPTGNVFYFCPDTQTINTITGYKLSETPPNSNASASISASGNLTGYVAYRVFIVYDDGTMFEISSGYIAITGRTNDTEGLINATWTCPLVQLDVGFQALRVEMYMQIGSGGWIDKATFISGFLNETEITASTWIFQTYTKHAYTGGSTIMTATWGTSIANSLIDNVGVTDPGIYDLLIYQLNMGNFVGFILMPYTNLVGNLFYGLLLLVFFVPLYNRYKSFSPIIILLILFGGAGGLLSLMVPEAGLGISWIFLIVGIGGLIYKVFR